MPADADFLAKLLAEPADDVTRLVYADWLDEKGDPVSVAKAEFLRITVRLATTPGRGGWKKARRKRLQQLAAELDTDWLPVVSRLPVENCLKTRTEGEPLEGRRPPFEFLCDRRWEELRPTDDRAVRSCDACRQNVYYCDMIAAARRHAGAGHCIALDLGVIRRDGDLQPAMEYLGRPSPALLRRGQERVALDPVSAVRERRKREKGSQGAHS